MDWQKQLYPGLWCILFIITGLLIRIIKLISGSEDQEMIIVYYACFVASVVALCFLIINVATVITCRVPQLMSVLLTEFLSARNIFSVFVEIDFVVID